MRPRFRWFVPVLGESPAAPEPSEGALDDPSSGQDLEALGGIGALDDLQGPGALASERGAEFLAGIAAVSEEVAQPGEAMADRLQEVRRAVPILDVGAVDDHVEHQAEGVGQDVALTAHDLLARVIAPRPAAFRGFDALAVDHAAGRARLASRQLPHVHHQKVVDRREQSQIAPGVEIALHRRHRRKVLRQGAPLAARRREIQDRVHHRPQVRSPWPAAPLRRRKQPRDQFPFLIQQVAWITASRPAMIPASDIRPGHPILHLFAKTVNHNLLISLNSFSVRL